MRNAAVLLLVGVLGVLLAKGGVAGLECYSCHDCATLDPNENTRKCYTSCLASVTCKANGQHFVTRDCSYSSKATICVFPYPKTFGFDCYCNSDRCDPLVLFPDVCDNPLDFISQLFASLQRPVRRG
ncbi:uncharacterized protein LOC135102687 isoform X2 [Scylla paramamosain]|uniref:uncharacterized protein LOC135102687 isoform X2 n=1 Tax=Scylla paramamosain TaxID=85552 RepID=UPI00308297E8